jgi:nucleotide-binding universal stress UspA family protein
MRVSARVNDASWAESGRKGIKTILVPTDFSESSDVALQIAIDLAKQQSAKIHLLHVLRFRRSGNEIEMMERQIAKFPEAKSVEIALEVRKGRIHKEILNVQTEKNVDLIVIARHRKTESGHTLFRNVTAKVKKKAECSVLVVGAYR